MSLISCGTYLFLVTRYVWNLDGGLCGRSNADGVYESHQLKAAAQAKPEGLLRRFVPCCALRGLWVLCKVSTCSCHDAYIYGWMRASWLVNLDIVLIRVTIRRFLSENVRRVRV